MSVSELQQTPLGEQLDWLIALLNAGADALDPADLEAHVTPSFLTVLPPESLAGFIQQIGDAYGTLEIQGLTRPPTETEAVALVAGSNGGQMALAIAIEEVAPHRITGANPYPVPTADGTPLTACDVDAAARDRMDGLIDIDDRRLYLSSRGTDGPTVLFESGLGDSGAGWIAIESAVMMFARVCSYDRANTFAGASDPAPTPRKAEDIVADLHALLSEATVPCPYILVGHSYGGLTARLYASLYPEQVAGIVFVDASHEDQTDRLVPLLSAEHLEFVEQVESSNVEGVDMAASSEEMRSARSTHPLQPMPLFVLTAGQPTDPAAMPPDWPLEEEARIWNELHEDLAGLVPGGRRMVAEQSGHYIHQSQPVLVVEAIRVASITRVCTYDRANTSGGASDPAPTPRTGDEVVADLHALLAAAGESGPYVLVGHSVGAIFGRQYASRYPEDVAGLVLVDPSHEDQNERMRALLSPEQWLAYEQMNISIEGLDFYASFAQMKDARAAAPLRPMPLIVLTAGHPRILPPFHPAGR